MLILHETFHKAEQSIYSEIIKANAVSVENEFSFNCIKYI